MGRTLYVSQQDCYLSLDQERLVVRRAGIVLQQAQLPHLDQILIFGHAQVTTQLIQSCLERNIPIAYLVLLLRQRRRKSQVSDQSIAQLQHFIQAMDEATTLEQLMGLEGAAAAAYYPAPGKCLTSPGFELVTRTRRPPRDPVNAMLSFGYQLLWNHILLLIELQGLDPYQGCLHTSHHNHPCLASDLIKEFRAPVIDSLVLWLINTGVMDPIEDFTDEVEGCMLTQEGRNKVLRAFIQRMEDTVQPADPIKGLREEEIPRWAVVNRQVQIYKQFVSDQLPFYSPFVIR